MYKINRKKTFIKTAKKFFKKHPHLQNKFQKIILELEKTHLIHL